MGQTTPTESFDPLVESVESASVPKGQVSLDLFQGPDEELRDLAEEVSKARNEYYHSNAEEIAERIGVSAEEVRERPDAFSREILHEFYKKHYSTVEQEPAFPPSRKETDEESGNSTEQIIQNWGYIQCVAFSLNTALFMVDDYLERQELDQTVGEVKKRYWVLVLAVTILRLLDAV
ncbi:hypothetical protein [Halorussus amylolyticus]|uniref:hypothetical protein n=1 Tax=Halorussus amylolyticus TaxID=1126242 RepID=UPI001046FE0C|nr:hypothetical protein [Halorussus amylolyticus]